MVIKDQKTVIAAENSDLSGSTFLDVNLTGCTIRDVNLTRSVIDDVNLSGAAFTNCNVEGATMEGVRVSDLFAAYRTLNGGAP